MYMTRPLILQATNYRKAPSIRIRWAWRKQPQVSVRAATTFLFIAFGFFVFSFLAVLPGDILNIQSITAAFSSLAP